jgi:hypothetical protein
MRITIIPSDGFISVDGEGFSGLDLSFIDKNIHAIQWYNTEGEVEMKDNTGRIITNQKITSLSTYQKALEKWQEIKNKIKTS